MENRFIEIFPVDDSKKAIVPISDIKEIYFNSNRQRGNVVYVSGGNHPISEHEYNRLKAVLMGGEIGKQGGIL